MKKLTRQENPRNASRSRNLLCMAYFQCIFTEWNRALFPWDARMVQRIYFRNDCAFSPWSMVFT